MVGDRGALEPEAGGDLYGIIEVEPRRSLLERRVPGGRGTRADRGQHRPVFVVTRLTRSRARFPSSSTACSSLAEANDDAAARRRQQDRPRSRHRAHRAIPRRRATTCSPSAPGSAEGSRPFAAGFPVTTSVVTGPCGAGKSSLLNARAAGLSLRTGEVSEKIAPRHAHHRVAPDGAARCRGG